MKIKSINMLRNKYYIYTTVFLVLLSLAGCKTGNLTQKEANTTVPVGFTSSKDTINSATVKWKDYFVDKQLHSLIELALQNNQELNITLQEIEISKNEIRTRKGEYLPFLGVKGGAGVEKVGRYTSQGANDANTEIKPGVEFPEPLQDYMIGAYATWEIDIWNKFSYSFQLFLIKRELVGQIISITSVKCFAQIINHFCCYNFLLSYAVCQIFL